MDRLCSRPGCGQVSAVALAYRYDRSVVWIDHPAEAPDNQTTYWLCATHGEALRVPKGWTLEDRRIGVRPLFSVTLAG